MPTISATMCAVHDKSQPYAVPFRALVARDVRGLFVAGRCLSGDFWAHSSYRVTGNAVATGEAASVGSPGRDGLRTVAARAVLLGDRRPVGQAPADLLESCELGLERLGHGAAAAEAGGNSGECRHHEHGC